MKRLSVLFLICFSLLGISVAADSLITLTSPTTGLTADVQISGKIPYLIVSDANGNDVSASYLGNFENIQRRDRSYIRFGIPTNWQVDDFSIPNGSDGTKHGIDRYPGYDCLMLGVWDDSNNATGNLANARIYRQVILPAGRYYFCAAYNAIYNLSDAYIFAATEPLTAAQTPEQAIAYYSLTGTPESDDLYGISFTLEQETDLYLGWNADLTTAAEQEFRAKVVRLFRQKDNDVVDGIRAETLNPAPFSKGEGSGYCYELSGRRINYSSLFAPHSSLPNGVYIVNGKKIIIK